MRIKSTFKSFIHIIFLVLILTSLTIQPQGVGAQSDALSEIESAVKIAYIEANPDVDAVLLFVSDIETEAIWTYGIVGVRATSEHGEPDLLVFIAQVENDQWRVALQGSAIFSDWIWNVPDSLISTEAKATLAAPKVLIQGNGTNRLSLPWATGETWRLTGGAHSNSGNASEVWSSLDFSNSEGRKVRSARDGVVWRSSSCPNFVLITHPDGYKTGYYHLANITVNNGQNVSRGTALGDISSQSGCGGYATGAHVHFSLRNAANTKVAINNIDIGGWTAQNGTTQYSGCMQRLSDGVKVCPPGGIYNDGKIGSGTGTEPPPSGDVVIVNPPSLTPAYNGGMCGSAWYRFGGYNGQYAYLTLNTNLSSSATNSAIWQPNLPKKGTYKVEAYIATHNPINWQCPSKYIGWDTSDARYTIYHANGNSTVSGNQAPLNNQWLNLGNFTFNAGTAGRVKLVDLNGEANLSKTVSFSAMRFTLVSAADTSAPRVNDISLNGSYLPTSQTISYEVIFSENVTGVDINDFTLGTQKISGAHIKSVSGSGSRYVVSIDTGKINSTTGYGSIRLNLIDNDSIRDSANNPLGGPGTGNGNFSSGSFVKAPKPPLLLVHGWQGLSKTGGYQCKSRAERYNGHNSTLNADHAKGDLADWLEKDHEVWIAYLESNPSRTPSLAENAECLRNQINNLHSDNPQPITIVAHSMGGLVSRAALYGTAHKVKALYTLGTPHAGIDLAEIKKYIPNKVWDQTAVANMSTNSMISFNKNNKNINGIKYVFIGGDGGFGELLWASLIQTQGPNDGLVGKHSAVGWVWKGWFFADNTTTNPADWASKYPPLRYYTDEKHSGSDSYYAYPKKSDGMQSGSDSYECIVAIMKGKDSKYCINAEKSSVNGRELYTQEEPENTLSSIETISGLLGANQEKNFSLTIDTNNAITVYLTWVGEGTPTFEITLPSGQIINPEYALAHPDQVFYELTNGTPDTPPVAAYKILNGEIGPWEIMLLSTEEIQYKVGAIIDGTRNIDAQINQEGYQVGDTFEITASLKNADTSILGATVEAKLAFQDGTSETINLQDLTNTGNYATTYQAPEIPGFVVIDITASGNDNGENFTRQTSLITTIAPNDIELTNDYEIAANDENQDNLFDNLSFSLEVTAETAGRYAVSAELYSGNDLITQAADFIDLVVGAQTIALQFDGNEIRQSGLSGPYTVSNLNLTPIDLGITARSADNVITSSAYNFSEFGTCHPLTISHTGNGTNPIANPTHSDGCANGWYVTGEQIQLSGAIPSAGWGITNWSGTDNDASIQQTNTATMPGEEHIIEVIYGEESNIPTVTSISRTGNNPTSELTVGFSVVFSENVAGIDAGDFNLMTTGGVGQASIASVSGSGDSYLVLVDIHNISGNGTVKLELIDNDSIVDGSNIPLGGVGNNNGDFTIGEEYIIVDAETPYILSISLNSPSPTSASSVSFSVIFSEPVINVDVNDFVLSTSGVTNAEITSLNGENDQYTISVNTGSGNGVIRLDVPDTVDIKDLNGNPLVGLPVHGAQYAILRSAIFADVPLNGFGWAQIEAIYNAGITGGCSANPLNYCPNNTVTRAQMAVFLLRGIFGSSHTPPSATGTVFADVPSNAFAAAWIEQMVDEGITAGCGGGNFCPNQSVTRAQMAVFLLRAKHGSGYTPPPATGTVFTDVPSNGFAAAWIEQLVAEGITSGCGGGNYCPNQSVTRAQMAVFLQRIFNLPLP